MSAAGILTRPVEAGPLRTEIETLALGFLRDNGDTGIKILSANHQVSDSSDKADVYHAGFESDAGTNILEITFFANGTTEVIEL